MPMECNVCGAPPGTPHKVAQPPGVTPGTLRRWADAIESHGMTFGGPAFADALRRAATTWDRDRDRS